MTEPERGDFISIELTFADENGENFVTLPRIGPQEGSCKEFDFDSREAPKEIRIFEELDSITGIGALYESPPDVPILKIGRPTA